MKTSKWCMSAFMILMLFLYQTAVKYVRGDSVPFTYHGYEELTDMMRDFASRYPHLCRLYSVGTSVQGRELWTLKITATPEGDNLLKPNVKYIGNMHGNEAVGREMLLHLISDLLGRYGRDSYVTWLLDHTVVHIMPSMNPDGYEASVEGQCMGIKGRGNAKGYDLNRNFPDYFDSGPSKAERQPETRAIMSWLARENFVLSGNLHGGALVASYPFDNLPAYALLTGGASRTPDDDVFRHIASEYAQHHRTMSLGRPCRDDNRFRFVNGTTNGADWYPLAGGMQDYNYVNAGCLEVTFEISCCKFPHRSQLSKFWNQNRMALLLYLGEAHQGVKGLVRDHHGKPIPGATLHIKGREFGFTSSPRGEYWRILRPGIYVLQVRAEGYAPVNSEIEVHNQQITIHNITMTPVRRSAQDSHVPFERMRSKVWSQLSDFLGAIWTT